MSLTCKFLAPLAAFINLKSQILFVIVKNIYSFVKGTFFLSKVLTPIFLAILTNCKKSFVIVKIQKKNDLKKKINK